MLPVGAFQDRSTSASHTHISDFDKIWSIGLSGALNTVVLIFFPPEQRLPSYSLRQFGEVTFHVFLRWLITSSKTDQMSNNDIPLNSQ